VIDSNASHAYDRLYAAIESGVPVVIADFTATAYCGAAGVHGLLMLSDRAVVRDVQFRLVIPPGALLRRVLELRGVDHLLAVYPSVAEAARLLIAPAQDPLPSLWSAVTTLTAVIGRNAVEMARTTRSVWFVHCAARRALVRSGPLLTVQCQNGVRTVEARRRGWPAGVH
jgi:anti-anti-sigma regulatory factor